MKHKIILFGLLCFLNLALTGCTLWEDTDTEIAKTPCSDQTVEPEPWMPEPKPEYPETGH